MPALGKFEGKPVAEALVAVTNAGDGLSKALKVDPTVLNLGQKVWVVLECEVTKIRHEPVKGDPDALARVQILRAGDATLVDREMVVGALQGQRDRIERAVGVLQLPVGLLDAHKKGGHASGLVDECPACEEERALEAGEGAKPRGRRQGRA